MKYIKDFTKHSLYEIYKGSNEFKLTEGKDVVSFCKQQNELHYDLFDPTNGHAYVEIGGIKWATMNVGANSITDTGLYFAWGDTKGYTAAQVNTDKQFSEEDYVFGNPDDPSKYNNEDGKTVLEAEDDAATVNMGGAWRMPTKAEFLALGTATTSAWTANYEGSGVAGMVLTSNTDSSKKLFFPTGYVHDGMNFVGSYGCYWSSSLITDDVGSAYQLHFIDDHVYWDADSYRYYGLPVRSVLNI